MARTRAGAVVVAIALLPAVLAGCGSRNQGAQRPTFVSASTIPNRTVEPPLRGKGAFLGPLHTMDLGEVTLAYRRFGHGPDLVLIEGQATAMSVWPVRWLRRLAAHHTVTIYDDRGVGRSTDVVSKPLTLEDMADDAARLIGGLGLSKIDVLGWSTGGEIGLILAAAHPELVGHLITSGASLGGPDTVEGDADLIAEFEDPATPSEALLGALFSRGAAAAQQAFVDDYLAVPQTVVSARTVRRYAAAEASFLADPAYPARWKQIRVPVLLHNGEDDPLVPVVNATRLADHIVGSEVLLTPNAKHAALIQEADTVLPAFERFLAS